MTGLKLFPRLYGEYVRTQETAHPPVKQRIDAFKRFGFRTD